LNEWKDRFELRKNKLENSLKTQHGKSYTEDLLERLHQSTNPEKIMRERLESVEVTCSNELNLTVSSKTCKREWIFVLKTTKVLKAVAMLQDEHRTHFSIKHVYPMIPGKQSSNQIDGAKAMTTDQEWLANAESCNSPETETPGNETVGSHRGKICFSTDIYGKPHRAPPSASSLTHFTSFRYISSSGLLRVRGLRVNFSEALLYRCGAT
jgi:hypothetical protein